MAAKVKIVCAVCNKEFEVRKYRAESAKTCSNKCRQELWRTTMVGEKSPNWKGGTSTRDSKVRIWSNEIIDRDKKCIKCGSITKLCAHHIKEYSKYPNLRYDLTNGITLCSECHAGKHPELSSNFIMHISERALKNCKQCGNKFVAKRPKQIFCNVTCRSKDRIKEYIDKSCEICGKKYTIPKHRENKNRVCSKKCSGELGRKVKDGKS